MVVQGRQRWETWEEGTQRARKTKKVQQTLEEVVKIRTQNTGEHEDSKGKNNTGNTKAR